MKNDELAAAIATWKDTARFVVAARAKYVRQYAATLAASDAKNAEGRKADADVGALDARMTLELAEIEARAARWVVEALVTPRGDFSEA